MRRTQPSIKRPKFLQQPMSNCYNGYMVNNNNNNNKIMILICFPSPRHFRPGGSCLVLALFFILLIFSFNSFFFIYITFYHCLVHYRSCREDFFYTNMFIYRQASAVCFYLFYLKKKNKKLMTN